MTVPKDALSAFHVHIPQMPLQRLVAEMPSIYKIEYIQKYYLSKRHTEMNAINNESLEPIIVITSMRPSSVNKRVHHVTM